jgi:hypothetical protein
MNVIDHFVVEVLSEPRLMNGMWWVNVKSDAWGRVGEDLLMFSSYEAAKLVDVGYKYEA